MEENVKNTEIANEISENVQINGYQQIIKNLISEGCKKLTNLKIKNVNAERKDNYTRVSFTLTTPIRGFITEDNGETWKEGMVNTIYTSLYAITGAIKEDEELSWMGNVLIDSVENNGNVNMLNLIFNGATIDIVQQDVVAGEEFKNPFSNNAISQVYDHDIIVSHIIKFKLGKIGEKMADKLVDKLLS